MDGGSQIDNNMLQNCGPLAPPGTQRPKDLQGLSLLWYSMGPSLTGFLSPNIISFQGQDNLPCEGAGQDKIYAK